MTTRACEHGHHTGHVVDDRSICGGPPITVPMYLSAPISPRVLARITEEDEQTYGYRCEGCAFTGDGPSLSIAADVARTHAVRTGHAVLVEAL